MQRDALWWLDLEIWQPHSRWSNWSRAEFLSPTKNCRLSIRGPRFSQFFKPPPPVGAGGGYMFSGRPSVPLSVRPCVRASVRASVIHVVVLCFRDISSTCWRIFAKLLSLVRLGTEMKWLDFGVKRSKFKVTAWPNASQIFMFPLHLQYILLDFRQTFVTGASWDTDDLITFLGQKVKVQGHTIAAEVHSTRCYSRVQLFLVWWVII